MFRFSIRDVLWLTVVAVSFAGLVAYSYVEYQNFHLRVMVKGQDEMIRQLTEKPETERRVSN